MAGAAPIAEAAGAARFHASRGASASATRRQRAAHGRAAAATEARLARSQAATGAHGSDQVDGPERAHGDDAGPGDAALLRAFAAGDQSAARTLTARHAGRVYAVALRMLGDGAEAEDVAQEAMLRLWKAASSWEDRGAQASTWLHRVTLNLCYDRLRKRRPEPLDDAPEPLDPAPGAEAQMAAAGEAARVRAALAQLPDRQRAAIALRHFEERSNPEIADALEVSVEAVESLLARGRRALKVLLAEPSGVEDEERRS